MSERILPAKGLLVAWAVVPLLGAASAPGQESRLRTLEYDPKAQVWKEQSPPIPGTAEGDLYAARALVKADEYRKAIAAAAAFVKKYGDSHELYPQSVLIKAQALVGRKKFDVADKTIQEFLARYGSTAHVAEALRIHFVIAENFLRGAKRRRWKIFRVSGEERGLAILDEIWTGYPNQRIAELVIKTKADHLFQRGDHTLAELEYARLLRDYPQSRYQQFALARTAQAALASFGGVEYDEAALIEAQERYVDYRRAYRGAAERDGVDLILESIREMRAEKDLRIGEYYERINHAESAIFYYRGVRERFPDTLAAAKAVERLSLLGAPTEAEGT